MALKQKPDPASSVVFARFGRPKLPPAILTLPTAAVASTLVEIPPAINLTGKHKVLFFIGRGKTGKTPHDSPHKYTT